MLRHIRLKEWGIDVDVERIPQEASFKNADHSLGKGPFRFRTDENGFIVSGFATNSAEPAIVVLGDSVVECMFVPEGKRMTDRAEKALRVRGLDCRVLNGGSTGATALHLLNVLLAKVIPMRPAAVVLMNGIIDLDCAVDAASFWSPAPFLTPFKYEPALANPPPVKNGLPPDFTDRTRLLHVFKTACAQFEVPLVMATLPHRAVDAYAQARQPWFDKLAGLRRLVNANTREFCEAARVPLLDLEATYEGVSELFYDQFHLNEYGSLEVGESIAEGLASLPFIEKTTRSPASR